MLTGHRLSARLAVLLLALVICLSLFPDSASSLMVRTGPMQEHLFLEGKKLYDAGHIEAAIRVWNHILPDRVYGPVAQVLIARGLLRLRRPEEAEAVSRDFLEKNPKSVYRELVEKVHLQALCSQNKPEARKILSSMIRTASTKDKPHVLVQAADLERRRRNYTVAASHYRRLFLDHPATVEGMKAADRLAWMVFHGKIPAPEYSQSEQLTRAARLFKKGRFLHSAEVYKSLLAKNPEDTDLRIKLGKSLYKGRKNKEAIKTLKECLKKKLTPKQRMESIYVLSKVYWRLDRDKDFRLCCKAILEQGPANLKRKVVFNMGAHQLERHNWSEAEKYFSEFLKLEPSRSRRVDAKWKLAWIMYFTQRYGDAGKSFREARVASASTSLRLASKYWEAKCLLRTGKTGKAEALFREIIRQAPLGYYSMQAFRILKGRGVPGARGTVSPGSFPETELTDAQSTNHRVSMARKLMENHLHEFALLHLEALPGSLKAGRGMAFLTAKAAHGAHMYRKALDILSRHFPQYIHNPPVAAPPDFVEIAYPRVHRERTVHAAKSHSMDPYLIWAVMRQESRYDPSAVSPAGAIGLMQVTPGAAGLVRKSRRASPKALAQLLNPQKNMEIGTEILAQNLRSFHGRLVPAIASYNADIRKVKQWYKRGRKLAQDEFIETIPYFETRNYVKKVLAGYLAYNKLHSRKNLAGLW